MKLRNILLGATIMFGFAVPAFAQGAMPPPPPNGAGHFDMVDTNHDGFLSKDEIKSEHMKKFDAIDANRDGFLIKDEMKSFHENQMKKRMGAFKERRINHIDENNDGVITKEEWVNGPERARKLMAERMAKRFDELDSNRDGKLTSDELNNLKMNGHEGKKKVFEERKKMHDPDTNKDGKISRNEWAALPMPMFDNADANNDGKISRDEARNAMDKGHKKGHGEGGFMPKGQ